jgi:deazaflavin-dependent oxidoreductase (nitroreductase family)
VAAQGKPEPIAARLHFIPRALRGVHRFILSRFRPQLLRSETWVVLTTRGRKSGLSRQVLLPCTRTADFVVVISTYGHRSDWIRNLVHDPNAEVTHGGTVVAARAEIVENLEEKREWMSRHPFFPPLPSALVHRVLRPFLVPFLHRWVRPRPVVVLRYVNSEGE